MPTIPHKVGTTWRDSFFYLNSGTMAGVTGKVQADFTIDVSKDGVGNIATTGLTITEVDATNNPGEYSISGSLSSFVATTGLYVIRIYDTASPDYTWDMTVQVTSDGTFGGTWGAVSFTAVASNGRVMTGATPLEDAQVFIKTPAGVLYTIATTDASGLWGPVYFSDAGTYTAIVQKSGYGLGSFTLVVTGATVTGPATDITLTANAAGSSITLSQLMAYGRRQIRDNVGTKADAEIKSAVNDALVMYARTRLWPWYQTQATLRLRPVYATGTMTFTQDSAVITLSGGTIPTWVDANCMVRQGGQWFRVLTRDSGTQITLSDAFAEATVASTAWAVFKNEYDLADDCMKFVRLFPGSGWVYGGEPMGYTDILTSQNAYMGGQKFASLWAIYKNRFVCWPYPSENTSVNYLYYRSPAALVSAGDEADVDPLHLDVIQRAIDYQLAIRYGTVVAGDTKATYDTFEKAMKSAASMDKSPVQRGSLYATYDATTMPPRVIT